MYVGACSDTCPFYFNKQNEKMKKIKFNTKRILACLSQVAAVVSQKNTMPILASVKLETEQNSNAGVSLKITASDSETWVTEIVDVDGDSDINICVDADDFLKGLRNLDCENAEIEINEETNMLTCKYGNGFFSISFSSASEFPFSSIDVENISSYNVNAKKILSFISSVGFAVNSNELRPVFNTIHFDFFEDRMVIVATDGQRLAKISDSTKNFGQGKASFNFPSKPANFIMPILASCNDDEEIQCQFNDKVIIFKGSFFTFTSRLIEGRYPNYDNVIPKEYNSVAIVPKKVFISSIKRVSAMGDSNSELVKIKFGHGEMEITAENTDFCKKAEETLQCNYDGIGEFQIGFKSSHLIQSFQNINSDEIEMKLISHDRACIMEPHTKIENIECKYLLMPLLI